jgi:hypothetical protein
MNATISLARAETLARNQRVTLAAPQFMRPLEERNGLFHNVVGVVHTFNFLQAGMRGKQGSILGFFQAGTFLERQFKAGTITFFVVTAEL